MRNQALVGFPLEQREEKGINEEEVNSVSSTADRSSKMRIEN